MSSGLPYKTKMDMAKTRNNYLSNLKLQTQINDQNYNANKTYIRTGQLPVEPTDTRSLTDKLADTQRMKIDLRSKLHSITDGENAGLIVSGLTPDELIFLTQQYAPIFEYMKKNYSVGVPATIFVNYLRRYIEKSNQTMGIEFGLQQSSAQQLIANQQTIMDQMATFNDIRNLADMLMSVGEMSNELQNEFEILSEFIFTLPQYMSAVGEEVNAVNKEKMEQLMDYLVEELPTKSDLMELQNELNDAIRLRDRDEITKIINKITGQISGSIGEDFMEQIEILKTMIQQSGEVMEGKPGPAPQSNIDGFSRYIDENITVTPDTIKDLNILTLKGFMDECFKLLGTTDRNTFIRDITRNEKYPSYSTVQKNKSLLQNVCNALIDYRKELSQKATPPPPEPSPPPPETTKAIPTETTKAIPTEGFGMRGRGIRAYPSMVLDGDVDYNNGISAEPKFIPIGRYLINKNKLNNNIIAIKRPKGSIITKLPSQRVTKHMGNIIRKIIGGSIPTYDDYNELNDDEKIFLKKIANETQITDKLSIPTPKKSEDDKEINQFEILKGQILSGNDNPDLVKQFKTIILKLSKKDLIPKSQVRDLLIDLTTLGH